MSTLIFALSVVAICLGALWFGFRSFAWLFAGISGWRKLEKQFACDATACQWTHRSETIQVGPIRFRRSVSVAIHPDALSLSVMAPFRYRALRIPWAHITALQPGSCYGRPAMRFWVEGTAITVYPELYAAMHPHLAAAAKHPNA